MAFLVELNMHVADASHSATVKDTVDFSNGNWTDATRYVESLAGGWQMFPPEQAATLPGFIPPAQCSFRLDNTDGRFSIDLDTSPYYDLLRMDAGSGGIYQLPVRVWVGFYDHPSLTPHAATSNFDALSATQTTMQFNDAVNAGCILLIGTEQIAVMQTGVAVATVRVTRGFNGTTAATHLATQTATYIGAMTPQFTGVVTVPDEYRRSQVVPLQCLDRAGLIMAETGTAPTTAGDGVIVYVDKPPDYLIGKWLDELPATPPFAPVPSGQRSLDHGISLVPLAYIADTNIYAECAASAESEGGICYFAKDGTFRFWNGQHLLDASSVYDFDTSTLTDFTAQIDFANIFARVTTTYAARFIGPPQLIYQLSEVIIVPAATAAPYGTPITLSGAVTSIISGAITASGSSAVAGDVIAFDGEMALVMTGSTTALKVSRGFAGTGAVAELTTLAAGCDAITGSLSLTATDAIYDTLLIESELVFVTTAGTSTAVTRGIGGSDAVPHASGTKVFRVNGSAHASGVAIKKVTPVTFDTELQFQFASSDVDAPATGPQPAPGSVDSRDLVAFTGGGTDIGSGISLSAGGGSFVASATKAVVTITNYNCFSQAFVTKFQVRGTTLLGFPAKVVSVEKTPIPSSLSSGRTYPLASNQYAQDEAQVHATVEMLADRWKQGRRIPRAPNAPGIPMLEGLDRVRFVVPGALSAPKTGFVVRVDWRIEGLENGSPKFVQDIQCVSDDDYFQSDDYFIIGTDALTTSHKAWY